MLLLLHFADKGMSVCVSETGTHCVAMAALRLTGIYLFLLGLKACTISPSYRCILEVGFLL